MAKEVVAQIKLYVPAGQANPAPPVGPALGQHGVNIMMFCKAFNEKTKGREGLILPAVITVYKDKSFDFIIKTPPSAVLIKKAKMEDLNTADFAQAVKTIEGTARSMGIEVVV